MKKVYPLLIFLCSISPAFAQINSVQMGSSGNLYTVLVGNVNSLAANDEANTVVLAHRNNPAVNGGSTAEFRYDVSINGGNSFTNNQGVLNPVANTTTNASRYPNAAIYNPVGNTNGTNAYLGYYGATVDLNSTNWNGHISGVAQLNNASNTFTETINTFNGGNTLIPRSLTNGVNGIFWAVDHGWNSGTNAFTGEVIVSKGNWNTSTNDIDWAVDTIFDPTYDTFLTGNPQFATASLNIAFAPNGMDGWVAFGTDMTVDGDAILNPTFYYTTDGGATWEGPIIGKLQNFSDIEAFTGGNGTTQLTTMAFDADLTVDANGVPHYVTVLGPGPDNVYSIFNPTAALHLGVYDITVDTSATGDCQLNPLLLRETATFRGTFGAAVQDNRPQASRTADGTKVFFGWLDSGSGTAPTNSTPDLWARSIDITAQMMTPAVNITGGDLVWDNDALFSTFAEEVFESGTDYDIPTFFVEFTGTDLDPVNFHYIQDVSFSDGDYTIPIPSFTSSINSSLDPLCHGQATGTINVIGSTSTIGSPLNTGNFSGVASAATNTKGLVFSPPADIIITGIKIPTSAGTAPQNIQVVTLPGINPSTASPFTTVYYDTAIVDTGLISVFIPIASNQSVGILGGRGGATLDLPEGGGSGLNANIGGVSTQIRSFNYPGNISLGEAPTGSGLMNIGQVGQIEIQFTVADVSYLWDDPIGQTTPSATSLSAGTYTVIITNGSGCTLTQTTTLVDPPIINLNSTTTDVLCYGDSTGTVDLMISGGFPPYTYSWFDGSTVEDQFNLPEGTFSVAITDSSGCELVETFTLNEPDSITIPFVTIENLDCWGDGSGSIAVTASGGVGNYNYNWLPGGFNGDNPTDLDKGFYNVTVSDGNGCTLINQYFVDQPDSIGINVFTTADYNGSSGTASSSISGDFPPFSILWSTASSASFLTGLAAGTYTITVTDNKGCTFAAEAVIDNVTSAENPGENIGNISLFPNPVSDELNVAVNLNENQDVSIRVTDLMGREVQHLQLGLLKEKTVSLDLSEQPPGVYLVNVLMGEQSVVHKITVAH